MQEASTGNKSSLYFSNTPRKLCRKQALIKQRMLRVFFCCCSEKYFEYFFVLYLENISVNRYQKTKLSAAISYLKYNTRNISSFTKIQYQLVREKKLGVVNINKRKHSSVKLKPYHSIISTLLTFFGVLKYQPKIKRKLKKNALSSYNYFTIFFEVW